VNRREQIKMAADEAAIFMSEERTVICATNGKDGYPHLMPLWYVLRGDEVWSWTFAKSQKVRNLERDPRATLQIEAGTNYDELRGVMLKTAVTIHRDTDDVTALGLELYSRYAPDGSGELADEVRAMVHKQAPKRVALQFTERSRTSWDHRKL
jgi:PPOX class probable F420-dependent enzyme